MGTLQGPDLDVLLNGKGDVMVAKDHIPSRDPDALLYGKQQNCNT
jgi:hypothetical protein